MTDAQWLAHGPASHQLVRSLAPLTTLRRFHGEANSENRGFNGSMT